MMQVERGAFGVERKSGSSVALVLKQGFTQNAQRKTHNRFNRLGTMTGC
jgi:hypothetical protein